VRIRGADAIIASPASRRIEIKAIDRETRLQERMDSPLEGAKSAFADW
jgi:hypothetical protein